MKILTTHVGSLPRSQRVVDFIFAREKSQKYNQEAFDIALSDEIEFNVRKQKEIGISIVSDGEASKISYATYIKDRYKGFDGDSLRTPPADLKLFPKFLEKLSKTGGTPQYSRPMCVDKIESKNNGELEKDIKNLVSSMKKNKIYNGFMNSASPGVISLFLQNNFYKSRELYLEALSNIMKFEYEKIVASGLDLQIDCPDLALSRHMIFSDLNDDEFLRIANLNVEALNYSISNIPKEKIRIHICWGNYEGPHICDIPMEKMFDTLMNIKGKYFLFESANPRHGHEWSVFDKRKKDIPDDIILVPGVIDTTTNFIEHPELVAQRLQNFVNIVGKERVVGSTDCGFATFAGFGAIETEIAYRKLSSLVEGAELIS